MLQLVVDDFFSADLKFQQILAGSLIQRSFNEQWKKGPWLVGLYTGWKTTQLYGDYFIHHEIRIPINQPGFNGK